MSSILTGHLSLQEMIARTIDSAETKIASLRDPPRPVTPVVEKTASAGNDLDSEDLSKLAQALYDVGEALEKSADSIELGGESAQGGMVLPTNTPLKGKQPASFGHSKSHEVPSTTPMQSDPSQGATRTQVANNAGKTPGGAAYPAGGVLKTAMQDELEKMSRGNFTLRKSTHEKEETERKEESARAAKESLEDAKTLRDTASSPHAVMSKRHPLDLIDEARAHEEVAKLYGEDAAKSISLGERRGRSLGGLGGAVGGLLASRAVARGVAPVLGTLVGNRVGAAAGGKVGKFFHNRAAKKAAESDGTKTSAAAQYILNKIAESAQGGLTQDSPSESGVKIPSDAAGGNDARKHIRSMQAAIDMKKVDGKVPVKRQLKEVLTEPALDKTYDPVVQQNLRNASQGGVKIAAVKAYLHKVKEAGCKCAGSGACKFCKLSSAMAGMHTAQTSR